MNKSEDPESTRDASITLGRVSEDPESTRDASITLGRVSEDNDNIRESGFERVDAQSVTVLV